MYKRASEIRHNKIVGRGAEVHPISNAESVDDRSPVVFDVLRPDMTRLGRLRDVPKSALRRLESELFPMSNPLIKQGLNPSLELPRVQTLSESPCAKRYSKPCPSIIGLGSWSRQSKGGVPPGWCDRASFGHKI